MGARTGLDGGTHEWAEQVQCSLGLELELQHQVGQWRHDVLVLLLQALAARRELRQLAGTQAKVEGRIQRLDLRRRDEVRIEYSVLSP